MKVVVTGGCGFIGSHVVETCVSRGYETWVIDNLSTGRKENLQHLPSSSYKLIQADLSDTRSGWRDALVGADWVLHLAALADIVPSVQNPTSYYQANVTGTFNLLEASRHNDVKRFVYAASSSCYGLAKKFPTSEQDPVSPEYPYALTKRMGEELVLHWQQLYGLPAVSLRFFNVYGTRSRTSGTYGAMFGVFLAQKLAGKPFTIVGDGEQTRDFVYVTDVANAVLTAAASDRSVDVYNVGTGNPVSIKRIVELLEGPSVHIPKRPGEPDSTHADVSKIKKELNWSAKISIEEGVKKLLAGIDYWRAAPVWEPATIAKASADWFKYLGRSEVETR